MTSIWPHLSTRSAQKHSIVWLLDPIKSRRTRGCFKWWIAMNIHTRSKRSCSRSLGPSTSITQISLLQIEASSTMPCFTSLTMTIFKPTNISTSSSITSSSCESNWIQFERTIQERWARPCRQIKYLADRWHKATSHQNFSCSNRFRPATCSLSVAGSCTSGLQRLALL